LSNQRDPTTTVISGQAPVFYPCLSLSIYHCPPGGFQKRRHASTLLRSSYLCFLSCKIFSSVHFTFFTNACCLTGQFSLSHIGHWKYLQPSEWTNISSVSPNSVFTDFASASISSCASFTLRYQGTVR